VRHDSHHANISLQGQEPCSSGAEIDFLTAIQTWRVAWVSLHGTSPYAMLILRCIRPGLHTWAGKPRSGARSAERRSCEGDARRPSSPRPGASFRSWVRTTRRAGYPTAAAFASDMCRSAAGQLTVFLKFCRGKNLIRFLLHKVWRGFAYHYNGKGYARNHYDTNMAGAYRRFSRAP